LLAETRVQLNIAQNSLQALAKILQKNYKLILIDI